MSTRTDFQITERDVLKISGFNDPVPGVAIPGPEHNTIHLNRDTAASFTRDELLTSAADAASITQELLAAQAECLKALVEASHIDAETETGPLLGSLGAITDALQMVNAAGLNPALLASAKAAAAMACAHATTTLKVADADRTRAGDNLLSEKLFEKFEEHLETYIIEQEKLYAEMRDLSDQLGVDTSNYDALRDPYKEMLESKDQRTRMQGAVGLSAVDVAQATENEKTAEEQLREARENGDPEAIATAEERLQTARDQLGRAQDLYEENKEKLAELERAHAEERARREGKTPEEIKAAGEQAAEVSRENSDEVFDEIMQETQNPESLQEKSKEEEDVAKAHTANIDKLAELAQSENEGSKTDEALDQTTEQGLPFAAITTANSGISGGEEVSTHQRQEGLPFAAIGAAGRNSGV